MGLEGFLEQYGYVALFVGTFLEGETVLIIAGLLAYSSYLDLSWVITVAFVGSYIGHLFWYGLGRWKGKELLLKIERFERNYFKVQSFVDKYGGLSILVAQFLYGTRMIAAVGFGVMAMRFRKYALLQFLVSILWAGVIGGLGYLFGETLETVLGDLKRYERLVIFAVLGIAIIYVAGHYFWLRAKVGLDQPGQYEEGTEDNL